MCVVSDSEQRVVLHVGLPKTGTTYLQALLAANRDRLRAAGYPLPVHPTGCDVPRRGRDPRQPRQVRAQPPTRSPAPGRRSASAPGEHDGTTIISHEVLAGASPRQIAHGARAAGRDGRARRRHRARPGPAGGRALAGGGQARRDVLVRRLRARPSCAPTPVPGPAPDDGGTGRTSGTPRTSRDCLRRWSGGRGRGARAPRAVCRGPGRRPAGALEPVRRRRPASTPASSTRSEPGARQPVPRASPRSRCSER